MSRHVCHITTVHPARDIRIFRKECSSLAEAGYKVTLLVANGETFTENGVNVVGVPVRYSGRLQRFRKTPPALYKKAMALDATLFHFHDPEFLPMALKLKRKGKKVIYDAHEDLPRQIMGKYWIPGLLRSLLARAVEYYENRVARRLDQVITATPHIRNRFKKVNANTTDINNFPIIKELMRPLAWERKKPQVCFLGGITAVRGISHVVKAMEGVSGVHFCLAGAFSPEAYQQEVITEKNREKIRHLGFLNRTEAADLLQDSMAGVVTFLPFPNHIHAQPNKMFEYMAAGLPVIASHFPLWKEIVEGIACGICVDPEDPEQIKNAIQTLIDEPERAQKMGENGQAAVRDRFNWGQEKTKLVAVYQQLLGEPEH